MMYALIRHLLSALTGLSPAMAACRFTPRCGQYCAVAVSRYGFIIGGWLCVKRLLRCQPWCRGGFDPVP